MEQSIAHTAYQTQQRTEETDRETETRALLSCTSRLEFARTASCSRTDYESAVLANQKLWTIFQVGLCEPDNPLPRDLKQTLLNLSVFVDKTCFRALTEQDRNIVQSLISINRTIAAGLAKKPGETQPTTTATQPTAEPQSVMTVA